MLIYVLRLRLKLSEWRERVLTYATRFNEVLINIITFSSLQKGALEDEVIVYVSVLTRSDVFFSLKVSKMKS